MPISARTRREGPAVSTLLLLIAPGTDAQDLGAKVDEVLGPALAGRFPNDSEDSPARPTRAVGVARGRRAVAPRRRQGGAQRRGHGRAPLVGVHDVVAPEPS